MIAEAEMFRSKGDIYFKYNLYCRAQNEYQKAYETYPYLEGIKGAIQISSIPPARLMLTF